MIEIQNTRINEQFLETNSTIDNFVNKDREKKKFMITQPVKCAM